MALGKDGNSKHSTSYKPYDASNSFVKKITDKVSGLIGWRTNSYDSGAEQNHEGSPSTSSTDDEAISPTPKRIKIQREVDTFIFTPKPAANEACNSVSQINDISCIAGPSYKSNCIASSTPAVISCAKNSPPSTAPNVTDYLDGAPSNISLTLPTTSTRQRHNITVPGVLHRDMSNYTTYDVNKSLSELSSPALSQRRPSFNAEVFSASSKRLSLSVCESRNRSCMSPFYSARTMYGGASSLLPYSSQSTGRLRSASVSSLNVFSPKNQITVQPVPSPNKGANDQETMSTAARRILDTLEKYCSPVKDAKRIPINESTKKTEDDRPYTPRGVKRKLPALTQIMPSTTDLLRIKRQEKMQDSVLSARQVVSNVPESFSAKDSDSSSDSADLDYSVRAEDPIDNIHSQRFKGKLTRKDANKFDDRPPAPLKLPNAVLKISNLPKFNITDDFTFSKPILPENFDAAREEETGTRTRVSSSTTGGTDVATNTVNKTFKKDESKREATKSSPSPKSVLSKGISCANVKSFSSTPETRSSPTVSKINQQFSIGSDNLLPIATKNNRWTCQKCLLENNGERCSSCSSSRPSKEPVTKIDAKAEEPAKKAVGAGFEAIKSDKINANFSLGGNVTAASTPSVAGIGGGESKDPKKNESEPKTGEKVEVAAKTSSGDANTADVWKNLQKQSDDVWKCDVCWIQNKKSDAKCVACGEPNKSAPAAATEDKTAAVPKPTFKFGIEKSEAPSSAPSITFGFGNANASVSGAATSSTFTMPSFGVPNKSVTFGFGSTQVTTSDTEEKKTSAPQATFNFGVKKTESPWSSPTPSFKMTSPAAPVSNTDNVPKTSDNTLFFNDVSSSTNNKKNSSFFKPPADAGTDATTKPVKSNVTNDTYSNENGDETKPAAAFNDITSSTEVPSKKKTVTFSSLFNKDATASNTNSVGSNGINDGEFKVPMTSNALTAVSSSNSNVFASNFSSGTMSFASNSKTNETPASTLFSNATGYNNGNTNDTGFFHSPATVTTSTIGSTFGLSNATGKNDSTTMSNDAAKTNNIFATTVNHNTFGVSSSQPSNPLFGNFANLDPNLNKLPDVPNATPAVNVTVNSAPPVNAAPAFRFGAMNAQTNTQPSGGFTFNGPKLDNAAPKFGFGATTNNTSFGTGGGSFVFGASAPQASSDTLPGASVFSQGLKMGQADGQISTISKTPSTFGNASVFGAPAEPIKKPGGFNFSGFGGGNVNDNQDSTRLNNSNVPAPAVTPFVFGSMPSQPTQQHNFSTNIPATFDFNASSRGVTGPANAVTSFTAQPSATLAPARKIKKAVRRTQKP